MCLEWPIRNQMIYMTGRREVLVQGQVYLLIAINSQLAWFCGGIQMAEFRCNPRLTCISAEEKLMRNLGASAVKERVKELVGIECDSTLKWTFSFISTA